MNTKDEFHCEFCGATGKELRNEKKGCCNNCGAPIGMTKLQADVLWENYYNNLPYSSTILVTPPQLLKYGEL
jgi:hypothetical protein